MELARLPPPVLVTYGFLLLAIVGLWVRPVVWVAAFLGAVGCGYWSGVLTGPAVVWPALLAGACWLYRTGQGAPASSRRRLQPPTAAVVVILAFLLGAHLLPGFHNPVLVRDLVLSAGASPYTQYLSFDKALVGLLLTGILGEGLLQSRRDWLEALRRAAPWIIATIALVLGLAVALGQVALAPKWTSFFWLWAVTNLFFTCVAEEAFFRGFLQRELGRTLAGLGGGQPLAVGGSAALFGLAHWAGGWSYVLLAAVAGLGYALAFRASGRIEMAILAHFGLNAVHFLLLTYPRLAV
jgi:membrane protease YdiL (CAAX protease family)